MNNIEKKLDALIDALGFDVERVNDVKRIYRCEDLQGNGEPKVNALPNCIIDNSTYKLTKRNSKQEKVKVWEICSKCKGSGMFEHHKTTGDCSQCKGLGKVSI